jgi:hypothetical protein
MSASESMDAKSAIALFSYEFPSATEIKVGDVLLITRMGGKILFELEGVEVACIKNGWFASRFVASTND